MPRFLALDWDQNQLHIVAAEVRGGVVKIQQAAVFHEQQSPNAADAEALGKLLRDRLREAGIAPAPVFVSIGRDRIILKDIRHPPVPDADEAALVRFQAVKELTEPPEEVVIDYTPLGDRRQPGERRALAVIVRRDILAMWRKICQTAGLKLEALTPRPFGAAASLRKVAGATALTPLPNPPDSAVAVAVIGEHWAEFLVTRGTMLLLARTLAVGAGLSGEIRRNLAVYNGQGGAQPVTALYLAGNVTPELRQRLADMLPDLTLHPFDPFVGVDLPEVAPIARGAFAGAVGLLYAKAERSGLPINFVQPRQPKPPANHRRQYALAGLLAFVVVFGGGGFLSYQLKNHQELSLAATLADEQDVDADAAKLLAENKRLLAIDQWEVAEPLDEIYDLADRIPDVDKMQLKSLTLDAVSQKGKMTWASKLTLKVSTVGDARGGRTPGARGGPGGRGPMGVPMADPLVLVDPKIAADAAVEAKVEKKPDRNPLNETINQFILDGSFYSVEPLKVTPNEVTVNVNVSRRAPTEWKRVLKPADYSREPRERGVRLAASPASAGFV